MQRAVDSLALEDLPDIRKHCLAAGTIAIHCGAGSAFMAGHAKEISDAFGPGDASGRDLSANKAGRRCAERSVDELALAACCAEAGY